MKRRFTPDDLFRMEQTGNVAFSPDGEWAAFEFVRSAGSGRIHQLNWHTEIRSDIWLLPAQGGKSRRITDGEQTDTGYWNPLWSPDGSFLAMFSIREARVRAWVWERATGHLRPLTDLGIRLAFGEPLLVWLSNREIACLVWPKGADEPSRIHSDIREGDYAAQLWSRAWSGNEVTASVLESGNDDGARPEQTCLILAVDVVNRNRQILAEGDLHYLSASPNGRYLAFLRADPKVPEMVPDRLITAHQVSVFRGSQLCMIDLQDRGTVHEFREIGQPDYSQWTPSVRWSADGQHLAVLGRTLESPHPETDAPLCVYRVNAGNRTVQRITREEHRIAAFEWCDSDQLLIFAEQAEGEEKRRDWWRVDHAQRWTKLTGNMETVPRTVLPVHAANASVAGVADGDLWIIRADGTGAQNLTHHFEPEITSIVWPKKSIPERLIWPRESVPERLVVSARHNEQDAFFAISLSSGETPAISPIKRPNPNTKLEDFSGSAAVCSATDPTGTCLWLIRCGGKSQADERPGTIVEANTWWRDIEEGEVRQIDYESLEGTALKGWVILPVGYQEGNRYPLVTWAYAGTVYRDSRPRQTRVNYPNSVFNLQLLAARGYAVLMPSMPLSPEGQAGDPYAELPKGVLPAIDRVVEMGIANEDRLGVLGHSYGGYTVYGLVTQTNRFRAAIAASGFSNLASRYGVFDPRCRYGDFQPPLQMQTFWMYYFENGQGRMGSPLWKDRDRYLRNSPLTYAEQVETPLMIIQGDHDYVSIEQGEEFFSALYRLGKPARFVRYAGEGHSIEGRANVLDMWARIYAWFDEWLKS